MTSSLHARGAVVTGGGRGIGASIARALVDAGAAVVIASRTLPELERVAMDLTSRGGRAFAVECDVADEAGVRRLGAEARRLLGAVDVLVNNAGVGASAPLARITLDEWSRVMAVNATGTFLCTREFLPEMTARGFGRVVNVASIAGLLGAKYVAHYAAAKHAVIGFTRAVACEVAGSGITVNAVCPGYVDTPMTQQTVARVQSRAGLAPDRALSAVLATTGQDRLVLPEEVAAEVVRLCRDEARDVNGQAIVIEPGTPAP